MTWAQKAAISAWSPALLIPQLFNTSTLGRFRRSREEVGEDVRKNRSNREEEGKVEESCDLLKQEIYKCEFS